MLLCLEALVCAGLVDGGQHLAGDPVLKGLCLGHLAAQNQAVQAGFVDDEHLLFTGGGDRFGHPLIFGINVVTDGPLGILVPQCNGNVLADQPGRAVDLHGAQLPELGF